MFIEPHMLRRGGSFFNTSHLEAMIIDWGLKRARLNCLFSRVRKMSISSCNAHTTIPDFHCRYQIEIVI
jgi:hypothetical protein